jgi:hypothetical protein
MGDDRKTLGDGLSDLMNTVNNLVTKFDDLTVTARTHRLQARRAPGEGR